MMAAAVLLYVALLYLRPGEVIPQLADLPLVTSAVILAACSLAISLALEPRSPWKLPLDRYVIAFWLVLLVSNTAAGWMGGSVEAANATLPAFLAYFLIRLGIRTERDLKRLIAVVVGLTLFQGINGLLQYSRGVGFGGTVALEIEGRITGTGIFNDPNDLAMALVVALPFVLSDLHQHGKFLRRLWAAGAFALLGTAIVLTNSRGGFVGAVTVSALFLHRRLSPRWRLVAAVALVAALVAIAPSRMSEINAEEDSAQGRVDAWAEGLDMFKNNPILGVGYSRFTEYHTLVAHNSFVHTYAELGLAGGFGFMGMLYCFFRGLRQAPPTFRRAADARIAGAGFIACALFLSRQYTVPLYVLMGIGGVATMLAAQNVDTAAEAEAEESNWMRPAAVALWTVSGVVLVKLAIVALTATGTSL